MADDDATPARAQEPTPLDRLHRLDRVGPRPAASGPCEACGSPQARSWATAEGPARLCPPCATLNGVGCP